MEIVDRTDPFRRFHDLLLACDGSLDFLEGDSA
jgi:hypothetical protein